jgi:hypothetical protein
MSTSSHVYLQLVSLRSAEEAALCHAALESLESQLRYCEFNAKLADGGALNMAELVDLRNEVDQDAVAVAQLNVSDSIQNGSLLIH